MRGLFCILGVVGLLAGVAPALAAESAAVVTPHATATLVSDTDSVAAGQVMHVGLLLRLAPGWHTYWKNPGEAGLAPQLGLDLPAGTKAGPIAWPAPERLKQGSLVAYAYTGKVLLSRAVTPAADGHGLAVGATADWLVCKDICIPEHGSFRFDLPAGTPAPSGQAPLFAAAERAVPRPAPWTATIAPDGTLAVLGAELNPATVRDAVFIPDHEGAIADAASQRLRAESGGFTLRLKPGRAFRPTADLSGVLLLRDGAGMQSAVAISARPGPVPPALAPPTFRLRRLWLLAFAGGVILNLMPCVFPVLAMKVLGLAAAGDGRHGHAFSYAAGVLASFAALGAALVGLRDALGTGAGWGFQFASPGFVAAVSWVMLAIGLNLSGVFRVGAGRFASAGQRWSRHGGAPGSFATGVLAVVVATPCTAPFMAGALAGALVAPPAEGLTVFLAMGVGLAAPYVALAWVPGLARLLPRPGRWMERLRRVLAWPMYATAAWLLWVLDREAGHAGLLAGIGGVTLIGAAAWAFGASQDARLGLRRAGAVAAGALVLGGLALLPRIGTVPAVAAGRAGAFLAGAAPFSAARLATLRAEGRPVFVDMTASWCLTCLVNEHVALDTAAVRGAFQHHHVALLVGDWTRQPPNLTAFLRAHGRDGVPLYLYFPAHAAQPTVLPQVLTPGSVVSAIEARG